MLSHPAEKYRPYPPIALPDRRWPDRQISHAPRWLSTDLLDGNCAGGAHGQRPQTAVLGSAAGVRL